MNFGYKIKNGAILILIVLNIIYKTYTICNMKYNIEYQLFMAKYCLRNKTDENFKIFHFNKPKTPVYVFPVIGTRYLQIYLIFQRF